MSNLYYQTKPCGYWPNKRGRYYAPYLTNPSMGVKDLNSFMMDKKYQHIHNFCNNSQLYYRQDNSRLLRINTSKWGIYHLRDGLYYEDSSLNSPVTATLIHKLEWLFL